MRQAMLPKLCIILSFLLYLACCAPGAEALAGDPAGSSYDRHIILQALLFFWVGIIGLVVIIAMKLKEAKRIDDMDVHKEDEDAPFLD